MASWPHVLATLQDAAGISLRPLTHDPAHGWAPLLNSPKLIELIQLMEKPIPEPSVIQIHAVCSWHALASCFAVMDE